MNVWAKVGIAIVAGIAIGVICALVGNMFNMNGALMGGVAGGVTAGLIATTMRNKPKG